MLSSRGIDRVLFLPWNYSSHIFARFAWKDKRVNRATTILWNTVVTYDSLHAGRSIEREKQIARIQQRKHRREIDSERTKLILHGEDLITAHSTPRKSRLSRNPTFLRFLSLSLSLSLSFSFSLRRRLKYLLAYLSFPDLQFQCSCLGIRYFYIVWIFLRYSYAMYFFLFLVIQVISTSGIDVKWNTWNCKYERR